MSKSSEELRRYNLSRRDCLGLTATLAAEATVLAVPLTSAKANSPPLITNDDGLERALPALSNWKRWGVDDQLGTLNFITAKTRLAAASLIRNGRVVPLGREVSPTTRGLRKLSYKMYRYQDALPEEAGCIDEIGMIYHGLAITHVDALCHIFSPQGRDGMYNGYPITDVTEEGALRLGIERIGEVGIVGRGVLLDIAAVRGGPLEEGSAILPEDLEAAERLNGVQVGEGDILFVRNGAGPRNTLQRSTGLHAACLPWLRDRRVAVLGTDSDSDVRPAHAGFARWSEPIHMVGIAYLGLTMLDNAELDALSAACAEEGRWAFFVTVAPWRFKGGTSSAVNPLAMF
jgi:kynurenine formamidase